MTSIIAVELIRTLAELAVVLIAGLPVAIGAAYYFIRR